tara:strand:- start:13 stop:393 length:381 start_codon:yes stop_codon:yes gene_type:complete
MKQIELHEYPSSIEKLSQDTIVSRLQPNGRFVDTYVADLVEGDQFYMPEKELVLSTDTEILDFVIKRDDDFLFTVTDHVDGQSTVTFFERYGLETVVQRKFKTGDTPALLGAFREMVTELIHNREL